MKKASIFIEKKENKNGHIMKQTIKGNWDKDMVRLAIESLLNKFEKPLVRWWEFWR